MIFEYKEINIGLCASWTFSTKALIFVDLERVLQSCKNILLDTQFRNMCLSNCAIYILLNYFRTYSIQRSPS